MFLVCGVLATAGQGPRPGSLSFEFSAPMYLPDGSAIQDNLDYFKIATAFAIFYTATITFQL
jgi:hypothetical protein